MASASTSATAPLPSAAAARGCELCSACQGQADIPLRVLQVTGTPPGPPSGALDKLFLETSIPLRGTLFKFNRSNQRGQEWESVTDLRVKAEVIHAMDTAVTIKDINPALCPTSADAPRHFHKRHRSGSNLSVGSAISETEGCSALMSALSGIGPRRHNRSQSTTSLGGCGGKRGFDAAMSESEAGGGQSGVVEKQVSPFGRAGASFARFRILCHRCHVSQPHRLLTKTTIKRTYAVTKSSFDALVSRYFAESLFCGDTSNSVLVKETDIRSVMHAKSTTGWASFYPINPHNPPLHAMERPGSSPIGRAAAVSTVEEGAEDCERVRSNSNNSDCVVVDCTAADKEDKRKKFILQYLVDHAVVCACRANGISNPFDYHTIRLAGKDAGPAPPHKCNHKEPPCIHGATSEAPVPAYDEGWASEAFGRCRSFWDAYPANCLQACAHCDAEDDARLAALARQSGKKRPAKAEAEEPEVILLD